MISWSTIARRAAAIAVFLLAPAGCHRSTPSSDKTTSGWRIDTIPELVLGKSDNPNESFAEVVGAAQSGDGKILVVDEGQFTLKLFDSAGTLLKTFGRNGNGPGEINFPVRVNRCGDSLFIVDGGRGLVSLFTVAGSFVRTLRYEGPTESRFSTRSACNEVARFIHLGWHDPELIDQPVLRSTAPVWLATSEGRPIKVLGWFPDDELWQKKSGDGVTIGPLPLGRRMVIAAGRSRFYLGTADRFEILVFDSSGAPLPPIEKATPPRPTTPDDIEAFLDNRLGRLTGFGIKDPRPFYHDAPFPKELPPYDAMVVDHTDHLWVRHSQQGDRPTATWTVFDSQGHEVTDLELPNGFDIYEIGDDYLLGRYSEPSSGIPEVRLYRLERP